MLVKEIAQFKAKMIYLDLTSPNNLNTLENKKLEPIYCINLDLVHDKFLKIPTFFCLINNVSHIMLKFYNFLQIYLLYHLGTASLTAIFSSF